ncbi:MAG: hypothetical protein U0228_17395 [Myxococcaceae bacterium]
MSLAVALAVLLAQSPPPLVQADDGPPPMPPSEPTAAPAPHRGSAWELGAFATATVPTSLDGGAFMFGLRGELDVWRIGAVMSLDRVGVTPFSLGDANAWTGLLGYSVVWTELFRVRALAGVSALTGSATSSQFAPTVGTTARVLWKFIGAEGSAAFAAGTFRQLDVRAAAILRGGIFELQLGYRARWIDATTDGTVSTLLSASTTSTDALIATTPTAPALVAGPHVGVGLVF